MSSQDKRLPWLMGGAILFIVFTCVCIVSVAVIAPIISGTSQPFRLSSATPTPKTVEVAPAVQPAPNRIIAVNPTPTPPPISVDGDIETQIYTHVYERVNPSVVSVRVVDETLLEDSPHSNIRPFYFDTGEGSGFVIDTEGHILTNRHVVMGASSIVVQFYDGILAPAEIVGVDRDTDLAVLKVDPEGLNLQPVTFGDIDELRVGDRVIVIGNPFGNTNTLTTGIISALGREIALFDSIYQLPEVIQTDAAINPGNSGGPMLNAKGEVIGVAFMLQSDTRSNSGIGFGIPVYFVERVAQAIINNGKYQHSYLGIQGNGLSPFEIRELSLPVEYGILVADVLPNTPAARAGLRGGDEERTIEGVDFTIGGDIIIAIDGQPIKVFDDLLAYLGRYTQPGDQITLTVVRDGEPLDITVTLGARPD